MRELDPDDAPPKGDGDGAPQGPTTRHDLVAFLIIGLLGIVLLAVSVGALFLPPGISFVLVRRGLGEGRPSWVVLGGITGAMWLAGLFFTARRLLGRARRASDGAA